MKLSKRAEKLRDELIQKQTSAAIDVCEKYSYPNSDEPLCLIIEDSMIASFNQGYSAARLEANVLEEALEHYESSHYHAETGYPCSADKTAQDALKKYREEQK